VGNNLEPMRHGSVMEEVNSAQENVVTLIGEGEPPNQNLYAMDVAKLSM